jgi:hypothetical protein
MPSDYDTIFVINILIKQYMRDNCEECRDSCIFGLHHANGNKFCQLAVISDMVDTVFCMLFDDDDDIEDDDVEYPMIDFELQMGGDETDVEMLRGYQ